jgi:solute carrier family 13 (sodium-dependent dicarboxylate transporter), member 2/3/5
MWISNTASAVMMVPIGAAVIGQLGGSSEGTPTGEASRFARTLMLGIAYSASVGGIGTVIGSPPNAIFVGFARREFGEDISFAQWMLYGFPIALIGVLATWAYLNRLLPAASRRVVAEGADTIRDELQALGRPSSREVRVLALFLTVVAMWIARGLPPFFGPITMTVPPGLPV